MSLWALSYPLYRLKILIRKSGAVCDKKRRSEDSTRGIIWRNSRTEITPIHDYVDPSRARAVRILNELLNDAWAALILANKPFQADG